MIHRKQILGLSALTLTTLLLIGCSWLLPFDHSKVLFWVLFWAGLESVLAYSGLNWSLSKSNKVFFSFFAGGSLLRLLSIGVTSWALTVSHVSPTVPLLALVLSYFLLSLIQLPFLSHGLR
jgi:hypothetical protein